MELILRQIERGDIEGFNQLMDQLTRRAEDQQLLLRNIDRAIADPDLYLMVAEDPENGRLCGTMMGFLCDDFCEACRRILFIENVVTDQGYRNRGVASQMFAAMENWAREKGAGYGQLCSSLHRLEAHSFYEKIGYGPVKGFRKLF